MNEPNILLNKSKLTVGQKVSKLANDHPVIATLTVVTIIVGLAALLAKSKKYSDTDPGRYTEFDTNQ
ncbi:MAG: hypothetical protein ACXW11_11260 [Methylotenera sp.]